MADIFSDIAGAVTKPVGSLLSGAARGLFPGAAREADVRMESISREKDMQQLQLMISMMKDPGSNQQTKKAASDTARRILFSYHPEFENIGAGPMTQRKDWWSGLTAPQVSGTTDVGATEEGFVNPMAVYGEPRETTMPSTPTTVAAPRPGLPSPFRVESIAGKPGEAEPTITLKPTGMSQTERLTTATGLRKEFNADKAYKDFQTIQRSERSMKRAYDISIDPTTKSKVASDQALAVSFQKMLDPTSVVRESEYARTPEGVGVIQRIQSYIPRLQKGGLGITDEDRKALYDMSVKLLEEAKVTLNKHIDRYTQIAKDYQINPRLIMGNIKRFDVQSESKMDAVDHIVGEQFIVSPFSQSREGQTATNPKTGKQLIFRNGQWQPHAKPKRE